MIKKLKRQKQKQEVDKIRLENLLIAQKEIEAGRKCTIMGRTFTKRDLESSNNTPNFIYEMDTIRNKYIKIC